MTTNRLPDGGSIDRGQPIGFEFDGRRYGGFVGDSLASALLANGVRIAGRSFKLHRPRGLLAAGSEEPNVLVTVGRGGYSTTNLRATEVELYDGLSARAVNCWPNAAHDVGGVLAWIEPLLPAGFYYKTFKWPNWHFFERWIRRGAGLGAISGDPDRSRYSQRYVHVETLVIGSGPAGLRAASAAASMGERVVLCDQEPRLGGRLLWDRCELPHGAVSGANAAAWLNATLADLRSSGRVRLLPRTTAVGVFDHKEVALVERVFDHRPNSTPELRPRQVLWQVRTKRIVLATGVVERPLLFRGNDRPGVMLSTAVRRYLGEFGVRAGRSVVIATSNDDAYDTAQRLRATGAAVELIVDTRAKSSDISRRAQADGFDVVPHGSIVDVQGTRGVRSVLVRDTQGNTRTVLCDTIAVSGGFTPALQLYTQAGGSLVWDDRETELRLGGTVEGVTVVGDAAGTATNGERQPLPPQSGRVFVDLQHDVTLSDVALAVRENMVSIEHLKRYTTLGMATDQGKTSSVNGVLALADLTGRAPADVGIVRARFPYTPVALGVFAGQRRGALYAPTRRLPLCSWHLAHGAVIDDYGGWQRPARYRRAAESDSDAERREVLAVRRAAGLFDGSPLGKIEVVGPDAATFLDRVYANTMSTLAVGRLRYGLMLNELGVIIDDGVVARLAADKFLVGTTSGGATRIATMLNEWLQCEWTDLRVLVAPVTTCFAVPTLTGPRARAVLEGVGTDIPVTPDAFPHMTFRVGKVAGINVRISRVSFTGEISYEITVPNSSAEQLWAALIAKGTPLGLEPVGIEVWMMLRLEKGYLHVGSDTDGTTSPDDVGWSQIHKRNVDFIGRRSLLRPENRRADRHQLVGLTPMNGARLPIGAQLRAPGHDQSSVGYITSSGVSPTLNRWVALAMVKGGLTRLGEHVEIASTSATFATIAPACAYDPAGERLRD